MAAGAETEQKGRADWNCRGFSDPGAADCILMGTSRQTLQVALNVYVHNSAGWLGLPVYHTGELAVCLLVSCL